MSLGKPVPGSIKRCIEDRVTELDEENTRLRRLIAELLLKNQQLRAAHPPSESHYESLDPRIPLASSLGRK
jgi:hypothetical protein